MLSVIIGILLGLSVFILLQIYLNSQKTVQAQAVADDILLDANEAAEEITQSAKLDYENYVEELQEKFEEDIQPHLAHIEDLKAIIDQQQVHLNSQYQKKMSYVENIENSLKSLESAHGNRMSQHNQKQAEKSQWLQKYREKIQQSHNIDVEETIELLKKQSIDQFRTETLKQIQIQEELYHQDIEKQAKFVLGRILNRFERPYCPERGIPNINFPNEKVMNNVLGPDQKYLKLLEQEIGVDLTAYPEKLFLNVSGFDPVRRELTRRTCENLMREKRIDEQKIKKTLEKSKRDMFQKIRMDGNRICKELGLKNVHPEIRNMMGSLRYRYSFSQNQHFHCAEVGWLCGLLSNELGLNIHKGRRAGMLHDIGKSMDHSIDGGHAVIGAEFISKHDEEKDIVHAVRAHHFDEQPSTDLAYLVIAADAISGARPGARRSTVESYTQKMEDLIRIGNSFKEVMSTYIVSAGREVRLVVDSKKVDDTNALNLSKKVADKIEEECTYPGQIRVTVIRQTQAIEYAK
tara:strand:+ start:812 stop:2368 length:1557 start_codon:yes stop_codon:yes gene_type:complete